MRYEGNLYRPPSEADAYILQATIGCSWNHGTYCVRTMVALARPTGAVFRKSHASNYLPLGGRLPRDRERICELIDAALDGRVPLRSPASRGL
ncbi:MAG TPA: hypothetical protein VFS43_15355 [Polyangiaceae bacterium]|nr:hypothetical protein [Polyangiaceae bacterium]